MGTVITLAILPLLCLFGTLIILVVVIYMVFRNLHMKNVWMTSSLVENKIGALKEKIKDEPVFLKNEQIHIHNRTCPACGAENPAESGKCDYCGAKFI